MRWLGQMPAKISFLYRTWGFWTAVVTVDRILSMSNIIDKRSSVKVCKESMTP